MTSSLGVGGGVIASPRSIPAQKSSTSSKDKEESSLGGDGEFDKEIGEDAEDEDCPPCRDKDSCRR